MAGASDPLEDMLFNEVDEKAVSDLVGSLESQLDSQATSAASYSEIKREGPSGAVSQFSGKLRGVQEVGSLEQQQQPQQGHPKAGLINQEPGANEALSGKIPTTSTSSIATGRVINTRSSLQTLGAAPPAVSSPAPGSVTLPTQSAAASFNRAPVLGPAGTSVVTASNPSITTAVVRTASPGSQGLNGNPGAVKLVNPSAISPQTAANTVISTVSAGSSNIIVSMASSVVSPTIALQRHPSPVPGGVAQNGLDPKVAPLLTQGSAGSPAASSVSQVMNHSNTLVHAKMVVPNQPVPGNSVILGGAAGPPPPAPPPAVQPIISQQQTQILTSPAVTLTNAGVKPAVNGVGQPTVTAVRPPVMATSIQQQRPGLVASPTRTVTPQLAVRPQGLLQLPPGFTIPPGMVLVRTETGQLVMVPQQVLAQVQAKTLTNQTVANISPRPATPTAGATIRVSGAPSPVPGAPQTVRLASAGQTRMVQSPSPTVAAAQKAITVAPAGTAVSVKMNAPQKAQTVITAGGQALAKPVGVQSHMPGGTSTATTTTTTAVGAAGTPGVSQEMQENVKKCKNFLATLIKLASNNSPSPDTSKNVKSLVQDLLDAKIEPEEFTTRLQAELKSSPQPYLIPFLKKSLPTLRQSLLNNQQSLMNQSTPVPAMVAPGATNTIRARMPTTPVTGIVRPTGANCIPTALTVRRPGVQTVQTRMPGMVITQTIRPQGAVARGPTIIAGKSTIGLAAQANQKKLSDPGGGTFRDDDDINDVASMAGVNLNEENARILATSSELVGTKIRSCKDEAFLPTGLLHRRVLETAKKFGVTEVPVEVVNYISHATQSRLRMLLEKVSAVAQHRTDGGRDEQAQCYEQSSDVRGQLRFFEQLERMEKQRKDEQEREILLKAAKSRARQEDPEQARLKAKAKEMQQQEQAQIRQRDANLTALAAIGPRKKRKMDSPGSSSAGAEVASGSGPGSSPVASSRQQLRHRITRVNLRDFIFCLEQERTTSRSLLLYKALLK